MFDLREAAVAYAKAADRVLGVDVAYIDVNQELVPVLVALLFQSIEISLKHLGIESGLFTEKEARDKKLTRNGHGVKEIADLVNVKLGANRDYPVVVALTARMTDDWEAGILREMLFGPDFESTRQSYQSRNLGYGKIELGGLAIVQDFKRWVTAVRNIAENLPTAVEVVKQWKASASNSTHFAIWY